MKKLRKALNSILSLLYYPQIIQKINCSTSSIFFVFPSWQIGGSERVHLDILRAIARPSAICFITEIQKKRGFKNEFKEVSNLIYLRRWGQKKNFKSIMLKKIAGTINRKADALVFGSNNFFLYDLIPYLAPHVKIIDLTHTFSIDLRGYERYSLNRVARIDQRIVLGKHALNTFEKIYAAHDVPSSLLQRFLIIPNKVDTPKKLSQKNYNGPITVLFVSRNSEEKRPDLFFRIVDVCVENNIGINFTVIGDFEKDYSQYANKVTFTGEIHDRGTLNQHYHDAHLILIPSTFEGFPMVLLESMAYGVVPICTNVGEIPQFISREKKTGFIVDNALPDTQKVQKFVDIIVQLHTSGEQLQSFSEASYRLVKNNFSAERFKEAYSTLLDVNPA